MTAILGNNMLERCEALSLSGCRMSFVDVSVVISIRPKNNTIQHNRRIFEVWSG